MVTQERFLRALAFDVIAKMAEHKAYISSHSFFPVKYAKSHP